MSAYVDQLRNHGWRIRGRVVPNCHLYADTGEELVRFALTIGMRREWLQCSRSGLPHFDLTPSRRVEALANGAVELTRSNFKEVIQRLRKIFKATT